MEKAAETRSNSENETKVSGYIPDNTPPVVPSGPGNDSGPQAPEEEYPPIRDAILIVSAVVTAIFLISLVSPSASLDRQFRS